MKTRFLLAMVLLCSGVVFGQSVVAPSSGNVSGAIVPSPASGVTQKIVQTPGTQFYVNIIDGEYEASQFSTTNTGISTLTGGTQCATSSSTGLSGCTVDVDPTYPNTEKPQGYGFSFGNQTANFTWPVDTHVHDVRNGVTADYYENPFSNVPYQTEGQVIAADFTLDFQKWPAYGGTNAQAESLQTTAFQGGYNFDNYFVSGQPIYFFKTYYGNLNLAATNYSSGQMEAITDNVNCHGTGDCLGMTLNVTCDGGLNSANDEGCHGGDWNVSEDPKVYTATLPSAVAVGATTFMTNGTNGQGTQGQDRLIVDKTTGVISGNSFSSYSGSLATGPAGNSAISPPSATDSAAAYPVSTMVQLCYPGSDNGASGTAGCTAGSQPTGYIPSAPNMINPASSITANVVASYTATAPQTGLPANFCTPSTLQSTTSTAACYLPASGTACISDQEEYESVNYTYNSTAQTITLLNLRFPHTNGVFFAHGGLCGYAVESASDIFTSGPQSYSQVFPVLGSPTSTSLYYVSQRTNLGYTTPILGVSNEIGGNATSGGGECFTLTSSAAPALQADGHTVLMTTNVPFNSGSDLSPINGLPMTITSSNSTWNGTFNATWGVTNGNGNQWTYYLPTAPTGTAPTSATATYCNENYKLYPAVRVNSVLNASNQQVDGTMNTMPVPVAMAANDTVIEPHYQWIATAHDAGRGVNQYLPRLYTGGYLYGMTYNYLLSGRGFSGFEILNGTAQNEYLGYGGTHIAPDNGYHLSGEWNEGFLLDQPGDDSVIDVGGCKPSPIGCNNIKSNFNLFRLPNGGNINWDPNTQTWTFGTPSNVDASPLVPTTGTLGVDNLHVYGQVTDSGVLNAGAVATGPTGKLIPATSAGIAGVNSKTIERVFTAGSLTQTYTHNLGVLNPSMTCYINSGSTSYSITGSTTNSVTLTAAAPSDIVCAFVATIPNPGTFAFTIPTSMSYVPSMSGTQTVNLPVAQTMYSGYTGTETYTTTGAATGITLTEPGPLANTANGNVTLSFPATQAAGTSNLTVSATDGVQSYSNPAAFTISDINQGLVDGWQMNEGSGTTFFDATSNANNQTFASTVGTWGAVSGFPGTAFTFNGTGGSTGSNQTLTNFTNTSPFSVSAWIYITTVPAGGVVAPILSTIDGAAPYTGWDFTLNGSALQFRLINTYSSNTLAVNTTGTSLAANTLYYVAATYNGNGLVSGVNVYINGQLQGLSTQYNSLTASIANANTVDIGFDRAAEYFKGAIGYARIYNRVLSATDVANYYTAGPK